MILTTRIESSLQRVSRTAWDALGHGGSVFLKWGFLRAAERSGSMGAGTGWDPAYVLIERGAPNARAGTKSLVGGLVVFVKHHSYGEYIFDWAWARASARAKVPYYPKLVVAAPMTPATGPRLLLHPALSDAERASTVSALIAAVRVMADELACSSIHWLYCTADEQAVLARHGFSPRSSYQFHWHNRGYHSFDDFLSVLTSRRRKQMRKERSRARAQVEEIDGLVGSDVTIDDLDRLDEFYRSTVARHGGIDYLQSGFFHHLWEEMPDAFRFVRARRAGKTVAGALFLEGERALYGRYWGSAVDAEFLHFELAYYVGIDRCIERGIPLFEAGAQGEHKLMRGFVPARTYSNHWIRHPALRAAVDRFLVEETEAVRSYMVELERFSPYKSDS